MVYPDIGLKFCQSRLASGEFFPGISDRKAVLDFNCECPWPSEVGQEVRKNVLLRRDASFEKGALAGVSACITSNSMACDPAWR
jgi:hypothetical protein